MWIDLKSKFLELWAENGFSGLVAWAEWRLVFRVLGTVDVRGDFNPKAKKKGNIISWIADWSHGCDSFP